LLIPSTLSGSKLNTLYNRIKKIVLLLCGIFNDPVRGRISSELEGIWKDAVVVKSRYYPKICLKILSRNTKTPARVVSVLSDI
jgi:hypothetical protein